MISGNSQEAKAAEPPSPAELRNFDARLSLEVADSPVQQALAVVKDSTMHAINITKYRQLQGLKYPEALSAEHVSRNMIYAYIIYIYIYIHTHIQVDICTRIHIYIYICIHVHIYI